MAATGPTSDTGSMRDAPALITAFEHVSKELGEKRAPKTVKSCVAQLEAAVASTMKVPPGVSKCIAMLRGWIARAQKRSKRLVARLVARSGNTPSRSASKTTMQKSKTLVNDKDQTMAIDKSRKATNDQSTKTAIDKAEKKTRSSTKAHTSRGENVAHVTVRKTAGKFNWGSPKVAQELLRPAAKGTVRLIAGNAGKVCCSYFDHSTEQGDVNTAARGHYCDVNNKFGTCTDGIGKKAVFKVTREAAVWKGGSYETVRVSGNLIKTYQHLEGGTFKLYLTFLGTDGRLRRVDPVTGEVVTVFDYAKHGFFIPVGGPANSVRCPSSLKLKLH